MEILGGYDAMLEMPTKESALNIFEMEMMETKKKITTSIIVPAYNEEKVT
ncbi:MAG: hypothetical protein HOC20_01635 [Chloroflexi bacterium]|jgi:hypothetical protein|nr:hypothetical protein [Chloroflexota bacterium]